MIGTCLLTREVEEIDFNISRAVAHVLLCWFDSVINPYCRYVVWYETIWFTILFYCCRLARTYVANGYYSNSNGLVHASWLCRVVCLICRLLCPLSFTVRHRGIDILGLCEGASEVLLDASTPTSKLSWDLPPLSLNIPSSILTITSSQCNFLLNYITNTPTQRPWIS